MTKICPDKITIFTDIVGTGVYDVNSGQTPMAVSHFLANKTVDQPYSIISIASLLLHGPLIPVTKFLSDLFITVS